MTYDEAIYEALLVNNKTLENLSLIVSTILPEINETEIDLENRTSALEQSLMPLPKRCHNHLCRVLISRFEHKIIPPMPPSWIFFAKGCIGTCVGLQKFCEGLAQNRSLTSLSISVLHWSFPFPATRIFTTSAGVGGTGRNSWDHCRRNEHPLLATIVHCSLLLWAFLIDFFD